LASEWLGDASPDRVRDIEERVNRTIANSFKKRDYRKSKPAAQEQTSTGLFVFRLNAQGNADFAGEVRSETETHWRVNVIDAVMGTGCGIWELSDEIRDLEKDRCRVFSNPIACLEAVHRTNAKGMACRGMRYAEDDWK
jgi:hypothetical protein